MLRALPALFLCLLPVHAWAQADDAPPADTPTGTHLEAAEIPTDTAVQRMAGPAAVTRGEDTPMSVRLPAQYWEFRDRAELIEAMGEGSGCGQRPAVMDELVWGVRHKDAPVQLQCLESAYRFLLRDQEGLEDFVNQRLAFVKSRLGESAELVGGGYENPDNPGNPVVHRVTFKVPPRSGQTGGCGSPAGGGAQGPGYVIVLVDYFVRPEGEDLKRYELRFYATQNSYDALQEEIEFVLGSLEYTGEPAAQFYAPEAPAAKLPGEDAVEETPEGGGKMGFMVAAFVIALIWMFMRRRKSQNEGSAA